MCRKRACQESRAYHVPWLEGGAGEDEDCFGAVLAVPVDEIVGDAEAVGAAGAAGAAGFTEAAEAELARLERFAIYTCSGGYDSDGGCGNEAGEGGKSEETHIGVQMRVKANTGR